MFKNIGISEKCRLIDQLVKLKFYKKLYGNCNVITKLKELASLMDVPKDTQLYRIELSDEELKLIAGFFSAFDEDNYSKLGLDVTLNSDMVENLSILYNQAIIKLNSFIKNDFNFIMKFGDNDLWENDGFKDDFLDNIETILAEILNVDVQYFASYEINDVWKNKYDKSIQYFIDTIDIESISNYLDIWSPVDEEDNWLTNINFTVIEIPDYCQIEVVRSLINCIETESAPVDGTYQQIYISPNNKNIVIAYNGDAYFYRTKVFWDGMNNLKEIFNRSNETKK